MSQRRIRVYLDLSWVSVPTAAAYRMLRWRVDFVRTRVSSPRGRRLLRRLRIEQVDPSLLEWIDLGEASTDGPMLRALGRLESSALSQLLRVSTSWSSDRRPPEDLARIALLQEVARSGLDVLAAELWCRGMRARAARIVGTSSLQRHLMPADVSFRRDLGWVIAPISGRLSSVRAPQVPPRALGPAPSPEASQQPQSGETGTAPRVPMGPVLYVLNQGFSYGPLYDYGHVLSDNPASPLHPSRVTFMTRGTDLRGSLTLAYASPASPIMVRLQALLAYATGFIRVRRATPSGTRWFLAKFSCRAKATARAVSRSLPGIKVALLAYDVQVPVDLILALESRGARTVAFSERPSAAFVATQPLTVGTMLTASDVFSDEMRRSPTKAVGVAKAVGMWRTDLLLTERSAAPTGYAQAANEKGMRLVAVLPFHYNASINHPGSPFSTALSPTRHFLSDMIQLASDHPDLLFVVRGKDARWVHEERFADLVHRVAETANFVVDTDYSAMNGSYTLVAHADLVIAKYTSLVDEALSVGIPCVIHDYIANAGAVARPLVPYLPGPLWAHHPDELRERVEFGLQRHGADFRAWWTPHSLSLYKGLSDGKVRQRARGVITEMTI